MEQHGSEIEPRRFGRYLRTLREQRRLSLDIVEEMSTGYPERITKSHLSRIENGQAVPTFPRMFTLSQIYGIPVSSLAERFEIELIRGMTSPEIGAQPEDKLLDEAKALRESGRYREALLLYDALLERSTGDQGEPTEHTAQLSLHRVNCLVQLARYISAREECEGLLSLSWLGQEQRLTTLHYFTICCYRLGKFPVACMALDQVKREMADLAASHPLHAHLAAIEGAVMHALGRFDEAAKAFGDALAQFIALNDPFLACRHRLNLAAALIDSGNMNQAREHLQQVLREAADGGYDRERARVLGALGLVAFREGDLEAAESHCLQSNQIARPREYHSLVFQNCFYLWRIAQLRGDHPAERSNERTLRTYVSRVEEFSPEAQEYRKHMTGGGE